jgi:hypothetical protein
MCSSKNKTKIMEIKILKNETIFPVIDPFAKFSSKTFVFPSSDPKKWKSLEQ